MLMPQDHLEDLRNRFAYHPPKDETQTRRYAEVRSKILEAAILIAEQTPFCREQSLAITKLEEALFFSCASIARNE